jgi:PAS domain-containing protein
MPFRNQIEHLEYRRALWLHVMGLLKTVHRHRLPGRRFGPDLELLVVYGSVMVACLSKGRFAGSSDIAKYLAMPRETIRRQLVRLVHLGLLEREGHKFRLSPATEKMPEDVVQIISDQVVSAANLAKLGRVVGQAAFMDNPDYLWESPPDGTTIRLSPTGRAEHRMPFRDNQLADMLAIVHQDDRGAFLDPFLRSLFTGNPYQAEGRARGPDGEYHWYRLHAVPVFKNGKIVKWSGANTELHLPATGRTGCPASRNRS